MPFQKFPGGWLVDVSDIPCGFQGANEKHLCLKGPVAQLVRAPPCHGGGREFESHLGRFRGRKTKIASLLANYCFSDEDLST